MLSAAQSCPSTAAGDDDEISGVSPERIAVEVPVNPWDAGDVRGVVFVVEQVDAPMTWVEQRLDFHEALTGLGLRLGDLEDLRFRSVEQLADLLAHAFSAPSAISVETSMSPARPRIRRTISA